jgi:hypothetical protein
VNQSVGTADLTDSDGLVHIYRTTDSFASAASVFSATAGAFVSLLLRANGDVLAGRRQQSGSVGPVIMRSQDVGTTWAQVADLTSLLGLTGEPTVLTNLSTGVVGLGGQVGTTPQAAATSEDDGVTWTLATFAANLSTVLTAITRADDGLVYGGGWSADHVYRSTWPFPPDAATVRAQCGSAFTVNPCPEDC